MCRQKGQLPRYLNKCRNLSEKEKEELAKKRKNVIRFHVPEGETIIIDDKVRGIVRFETDGIGDFVIIKSDGIPTYNYAVVIDDAQMQITHVIRGEEHLTNTACQVLIYNALNIDLPVFAHVSLILGEDRSKMSKRHGDTSIDHYRNKGYLPEAIINFLVLLGWSPESEDEIFTKEELVSLFSLERVSKSPAVFDMDKLNWINQHYIRSSSIEKITELVIPYLVEAGYLQLPLAEDQKKWLQGIVAVTRGYRSNLSEITEHLDIFLNDEFNIEEEQAISALNEEDVPAVLELLQQKLEQEKELIPEKIKMLMKDICSELNLGGKKVFMPIRVALTGKTKGPEMHDLIPLLGVARVALRIKNSQRFIR